MRVMSLPFICCYWLSSLLCNRSVVRVVNISDCLSVLWKCVSWRKYLLGDILLIVVYPFVVLFLVKIVITVIANNSVVIVKSSACYFWKVQICFGVGSVDSWFPPIRVYVSIRVINNSLSLRVSFLSVHIRHSFWVTIEIVRRFQKLWISVKEPCICS